jgi:hypothetical protein
LGEAKIVMTEENKITHDDVNSVFRSNAVLTDLNERLLEYLRVLCSTQIRSDENRLLANNRATTINAILLNRYMEGNNKKTTFYTLVVIFLATVRA